MAERHHTVEPTSRKPRTTRVFRVFPARPDALILQLLASNSPAGRFRRVRTGYGVFYDTGTLIENSSMYFNPPLFNLNLFSGFAGPLTLRQAFPTELGFALPPSGRPPPRTRFAARFRSPPGSPYSRSMQVQWRPPVARPPGPASEQSCAGHRLAWRTRPREP